MDPIAQFEYVKALSVWLVPALVLLLLAAPRPHRFWLRCAIAVLVGWIATVIFISLVYNPVGIAAGHALDQHFPEGSYDNNTVGIAIFFGWLCPAVLVAIFASMRFLWRRFRRGGS